MEEIQYFLQWIPKHIQIKLIHILGGYTKEEYNIQTTNIANKYHNLGFKRGIIYLATQLEYIAVKNYGCSKQEWINKIYSKIQEGLKGNVE